MNTRQSRPSVHRREEKNPSSSQKSEECKTIFCPLQKKTELQFPLPLIPTLKHTERRMFGKIIYQHLILQECEWQHGDLLFFLQIRHQMKSFIRCLFLINANKRKDSGESLTCHVRGTTSFCGHFVLDFVLLFVLLF